MNKALIKGLARRYEPLGREESRKRLGRAAGLVGIASNLLLFLLKIVVGLLSGSIAITADAVNNLSDCGSSVITLVGFQLAGIPADEKHPYGHARFEYLSGLAVSVLVLLIGVEFLKSAVQKIINPTPVLFSPVVAGVLLVSVLLKLWQGSFNKRMGAEIDSGALAATAADSRNDALSTAAVLAGALVAHFSGWQLDGWMGAGVAVLVLVSGIGLIVDTVNPLLGMAPDQELVDAIEQRILSYQSVLGLHDLVVHNYGPGRCFASVHVEVPASQDILVSHDIIDNIERDFAAELGINLVVHLDPVVTDDARTNAMRLLAQQCLARLDPALSLHDFRMVEGKTHTNLIFDVVLPPRYRLSNTQLRQELSALIREQDSRLYCVITVDRSYISTRPKDE